MARKVALSNPYGALRVFVYGSLCILGACSGGQNDQDKAAIDQQQSATTQTPEPAGLEQQPEKLVIAFGDSLYAGYGLKQNESLPHDLEKALRQGGINARVMGAGVSGDTTAAALKRFAFTLDGAKRKPDLVIIGLGGNDLLRGLDVQQTRTNIRAMLEELKKRDINAMLTGMMAPLNMGDDYVNAFNSIYTDLAKEYDAALYPFFFDGIIGQDGAQQPGLMLPDGIHPNAKGVDVVVERLTPAVQQELLTE